jgi:hypothetical protein
MGDFDLDSLESIPTTTYQDVYAAPPPVLEETSYAAPPPMLELPTSNAPPLLEEPSYNAPPVLELEIPSIPAPSLQSLEFDLDSLESMH